MKLKFTIGLIGCFAFGALLALAWPRTAVIRRIEPSTETARKIVNSAKDEVRRGVVYDPAYRSIPYPNGDVARDRGACTDVVIRSFRAAGFDLQRLIHEDMLRRFRAYPSQYHLAHADPNIDHRRIPNQRVFFKRHGIELSTAVDSVHAADWAPGDLVYWKLFGGHDHVGVVSDTFGLSNLPLVIHNIGRTAEEDCLTRWRIVGHVRFPKR